MVRAVPRTMLLVALLVLGIVLTTLAIYSRMEHHPSAGSRQAADYANMNDDGSQKRTRPPVKYNFGLDITDCAAFPKVCNIDFDRCTIDRIDHPISWEEFDQKYRKPRKPVMFTNIIDKFNPKWRAWEWNSSAKKLHQDLKNVTFDWTINDKQVELSMKQVWKQFAKVERPGVRPEAMMRQGTTQSLDPTFDRARLWRHPMDLDKNDIFGAIIDMQDAFGGMKTNVYEDEWIVTGATSSGVGLHRDYYISAFYNACIRGSKHWVTFRPGLEKYVTREEIEEWDDMTSHDWFDQIYPHLKERSIPFDECDQYEGDVFWGPMGGLWHITVNYERSVSVSTNFLYREDIHEALEEILQGYVKHWTEQTGDNEDVATRSLEFCIGLKLYDENLWAESKCNNPNPVYAKKRSDKQRNRRLYAEQLARVKNMSNEMRAKLAQIKREYDLGIRR